MHIYISTGVHLFERQLGADDKHKIGWIKRHPDKRFCVEDTIVTNAIDKFAHRPDMERCTHATFYMLDMNVDDRPTVEKVQSQHAI